MARSPDPRRPRFRSATPARNPRPTSPKIGTSRTRPWTRASPPAIPPQNTDAGPPWHLCQPARHLPSWGLLPLSAHHAVTLCSGCGCPVDFGRRKRGMTGLTGNTANAAGALAPATARRRWWRRSQPVAFYLFAAVLVILIPALVVSLVLLNRNNSAQEDVVRGLTNATVQAMGQSVEREIAGMITTLRVLSTSHELVNDDFADFHQRAAVALAGSGAYLLALDSNFAQLLNTRVPYGDALGRTSDPRSAAEALERGTATVSGLFFGQTAQQWVFNVLLPVPDNRQAALLVLTQNATNLALSLQSRQLPDGW